MLRPYHVLYAPSLHPLLTLVVSCTIIYRLMCLIYLCDPPHQQPVCQLNHNTLSPVNPSFHAKIHPKYSLHAFTWYCCNSLPAMITIINIGPDLQITSIHNKYNYQLFIR